MKNDTIAAIMDVLVRADERHWHIPASSSFHETSKELQRALRLPELAMESLGNVYLEDAIKTRLDRSCDPSGEDAPNRTLATD